MPAVLGVSEEVENEDLLAIVVNGRDQAKIVSCDVEHCHCPPTADSDLIGVRKGLACVNKACPIGGQDDASPSVERAGGTRVPPPVFAQGGSFDQPHDEDIMSTSWPLCQLRPLGYGLPGAVAPRAKLVPGRQFMGRRTRVGTDRLVAVPSPIWPMALLPQQKTAPRRSRPHVCESPSVTS